jgi:methionyl-tRNA formyltransferase
LQAGYNVLTVVTSPQKNSKFIQQTINDFACDHLEISNVNDPDSINLLASLRPSIFLVAGFSSLFGPALLSVPRFGTLNLHAGKLPHYRGGSPLNWQLINGESRAGISVIQADLGIDTGRVLVEEFITIGSETTILDLHQQANALFPKLVLDALACIERGETGRQQSEASASYWHQRTDADGRISFREMTASKVDLMVRALTRPYPGAWCLYQDKILRIFSAKIPNFVLKGIPGRLCFIQGVGPYVVCLDRAILLSEYEIENGSNERLRHGDYLL